MYFRLTSKTHHFIQPGVAIILKKVLLALTLEIFVNNIKFVPLVETTSAMHSLRNVTLDLDKSVDKQAQIETFCGRNNTSSKINLCRFVKSYLRSDYKV